MAGVPGIEPGMTGSKPVALPLGYTPTMERSDIKSFRNGALTRTRTADLMITNQLLYQLSYKGTYILKIHRRPYYHLITGGS